MEAQAPSEKDLRKSEEEYEDVAMSSIVEYVDPQPSMSAPRIGSKSRSPNDEELPSMAAARFCLKSSKPSEEEHRDLPRSRRNKRSAPIFYSSTSSEEDKGSASRSHHSNVMSEEYEDDELPLSKAAARSYEKDEGFASRTHSNEESLHQRSLSPYELHRNSFFNNASGESHRVEPAVTQQKKMNDDVCVDINQLVAESVIEDAIALPRLSDKCCIYRVPERLRQLNGKAYTPQLVSIGPLHHGKKKLEKMEEHKKRYLHDFLEVTNLQIEDVIKVITENEQELHDCYAETLKHLISSEAFVKIMLLDATFIIMLMLKYCFKDLQTATDRIFHKPWMINDVVTDMVLLENQIPFFILKLLFTLLPSQFRAKNSLIELTHSLIELTHKFFKGQWNSWVTDDILEPVEHFVDFLNKCQKIKKNKSAQEKKQTAEEPKITLEMPGALQLHQAGVEFKKGSRKKLHAIKFLAAGTLEIPPLRIDDKTEVFLKNLLAFEDCHCHDNSLGDYVFMINLLVNSSKDAEILIQEGIIENWLPDTDAAVSVVHNLQKGVYITSTPSKFCFFEEVEQLNKYCRRRRNKWKAILKQKYFNNPWSIISVVAAGFLLILAVIQTVCSILQVI